MTNTQRRSKSLFLDYKFFANTGKLYPTEVDPRGDWRTVEWCRAQYETDEIKHFNSINALNIGPSFKLTLVAGL